MGGTWRRNRPVLTGQPQGQAQIDWSHPIGKDLAYLFAASGNPRRDVANALPNLIHGMPRYIPTPTGLALRSDSGPLALDNHPNMRLPDSHTVFGWIRPTSDASQVIIQVGQNELEYAAYSLKIGTCDGGGIPSQFNYTVRAVVSAPNNYSVSSTSGVPSGQSFFVVATSDGANLRMYVNGVLEATAATEAGFPSKTFAARMYFGGDSNASFNSQRYLATGPIMFAGAIKRCLSAAEVKSLYENPYQIFKQSPQNWIGASASVTLPTLVQPASTTSAGAWTPTGAATLHEAIDEATYSDADYISVAAASTCELVLAESAFPTGNVSLAYRALSSTASTLTVTLKQGATTIMTRTHALTGTATLYTQALTAGEVAAIAAGPITCTLTSS